MNIQIIVLQNTHNGRDTHNRGTKVFSPSEHKSVNQSDPKFHTVEYRQYQSIR